MVRDASALSVHPSYPHNTPPQQPKTLTHTRTDADVGVDGGVARRAGQVLVLPVGDVLVRARVAVALGEAEVDDVHRVVVPPEPDEEVVGLHVPVDEALCVCVVCGGGGRGE